MRVWQVPAGLCNLTRLKYAGLNGQEPAGATFLTAGGENITAVHRTPEEIGELKAKLGGTSASADRAPSRLSRSSTKESIMTQPAAA